MKTTIQFRFALSAVAGLVGILAISWVYAEPITQHEAELRLSELQTSCMRAAHLTDAQFEIIRTHQLFIPERTAATTEDNVKCYYMCYLNTVGIFQNNQPNVQFLLQKLPALVPDQERARAATNKCSRLTGANSCEEAFNFQLCLIAEAGLYV